MLPARSPVEDDVVQHRRADRGDRQATITPSSQTLRSNRESLVLTSNAIPT